ncbi:MAG: hypothetical protein ACK4NA_09195 [Alphaproteobacteria bacterium]
MRGNPELIRNIWLEMSPHRLVVMPAVLGILFLLGYVSNDHILDRTTAIIAAFLYCAVALVWGTRVASESVIAEINNKTWDGQRMSALGPWQLAIGKLFGSTIYVWYGGAICLGLYALSYVDWLPPLHIAKLALLYAGCAVLAHAVGLLVSMLAVQKRREFGRIQVTFYQFLGLIAALPLLYIGLAGIADDGIYRVLLWYDEVYNLIDFTIVALAALVGWAMVGLYRLMRAELQMVNAPWVWIGFCVFAAVFMAGVRFIPPELNPGLPEVSLKIFHGYVALWLLAYVILFAEPKNRILMRRLRRHAALGEWPAFFAAMPRAWPTLLLLLLATILLLRTSEPTFEVLGFTVNFQLATIATFLFYLRDSMFVLFMNLRKPSPRADMNAFLYLLLAYTVVPVVLSALALDPLTALFWPHWNSSAALTIGPVLIQVVAMAGVLIYQWRRTVVSDAGVEEI